MAQTAVKVNYAPEPVTVETVLEKVRPLLSKFRERAEQSEQDRTIPAVSAQEMLDAGLARILLPCAHGGDQLGLQAWVDVCVEIGKADAAHAWCASLMIHHPHYVAQFPDAAQAAIWAATPDVAIAGSLTPSAVIEPAEGGYTIVRHQVPFVSGVNHASWVMIGGMLPDADGNLDWTIFLLPPGSFMVLDTWHTTGMRGTGSNTVVVESAFVPAAHAVRLADLRDGTGPGARSGGATFFHAPWVTYASLTFLAPMLGAARGALETYRAWTAERASLFGAPVAQYTSIQVNLARAASNLDAADLLMRRCVTIAEASVPASEELRALAFRDQARASEFIVEGMDIVMKISGAAGFATSSTIQRAWRDVHFAAAHVILNPEVSFAAWGRQQFGLQRDPKQTLY